MWSMRWRWVTPEVQNAGRTVSIAILSSIMHRRPEENKNLISYREFGR
jgi:hypothetical protein